MLSVKTLLTYEENITLFSLTKKFLSLIRFFLNPRKTVMALILYTAVATAHCSVYARVNEPLPVEAL
jgi:hypothetical protein